MQTNSARIAIIGAGFVADLYMRSLKSFPHIGVDCAFDLDAGRLQALCLWWGVRASAGISAPDSERGTGAQSDKPRSPLGNQSSLPSGWTPRLFRFAEAFAMGRPLISTYIAGIPELLDERCGLLALSRPWPLRFARPGREPAASGPKWEKKGDAGAWRVTTRPISCASSRRFS
jgi:hypothetical protein